MKEAVQRHIANLNWGYKVQLRENNVTYLNAFAKFSGSHTITVSPPSPSWYRCGLPIPIQATDKRGKVKTLSADRFIVATGLRPKYMDIPGREFAISSDDIFSLESGTPGLDWMKGMVELC